MGWLGMDVVPVDVAASAKTEAEAARASAKTEAARASTSPSASHGCDSEPSASNPDTISNSRPPSLSTLRDDNPGI